MITINNMSFSYIKGNDLLKDINLNIKSGMYLSILGENGSCKSTLIKLILGLLKPDCGTIEISTTKISYVPQRLDNFNGEFPITVKEVLSSHAKAIKLKDSKAVSNVLEKVNMSNFKNNLIGNLSGGQQQRIFIARALLGDPDLIILDEPSANLDPVSEYELNKAISETCTDRTVIFISHRLSTTRHADRILMLEKGRVVESGSHEELMKLDGKYAYMFRLQAEKYTENNE